MGENNEKMYAGISSLKSYYNHEDDAVLYNQRGFDYSIIADEKNSILILNI